MIEMVRIKLGIFSSSNGLSGTGRKLPVFKQIWIPTSPSSPNLLANFYLISWKCRTLLKTVSQISWLMWQHNYLFSNVHVQQSSGGERKYKGPFNCAKQLYMEEGITSLCRGTRATLLRGWWLSLGSSWREGTPANRVTRLSELP